MSGPFFTSDLHFGHENIIGFCDRPFDSVEDMHDAMINNWNRRVGTADDIYILGDFSFMPVQDTIQVLDTLKGKKHLVFGNHDLRYRTNKEFLKRFESTHDYLEISVPESEHSRPQHIVMCHYPILSWNRMRYGAWMLHGHTHAGIQQQNSGKARYDVGVDANSFIPVSYEQVRAKLVT